jgi:A/G-specific adenine glycosylase
MPSPAFADTLLRWFAVHGRHTLPWQQNPTPYRVWVSEIMLQQTQVSTVIPYYQRFMERFPDVHALADAPLDEVLHLWTGLGYYARGRNLHRSAQILSTQWRGEFPRTVAALCELPGIGRSTAGAILALGCGVRAPILDGNVKRVLCRFHGIEGWPDLPAVQKRLWVLAEQATPAQDYAAYTQAMMDLGATVCTRSRPTCQQCPLARGCQALTTARVAELPSRKPARTLPRRTVCMLMCRSPAADVMLEQRPPSGIWGGLWSFPEFAGVAEAQQFVADQWPGLALQQQVWPVLKHTFSHFQLQITPLLVHTPAALPGVMEAGRWLWYPAGPSAARPAANVGLAAPVLELLQRISADAFD